MKKLLLATAALVALALPAKADIVVNLGPNPTSSTGAFSNSALPTGAFLDIYEFTLSGGPQFLTIASVTNTFADPVEDFIAGFTGAVVYQGADNAPGGGDDVVVIGPVAATPCPIVPNCQGFAGSALLNSGDYHLALTGVAGVTAGYGGNLSTFAVPGPVAGALLPSLAMGFGLLSFSWLRRRRLA